MCGITGVWRAAAWEHGDAEALRRMTATLRHRGPDDEGIWCDGAAGIGLGHTRLAVLGLGADGRQPMTSPSGRFTLVYNGEIYNHAELRQRLEAVGVAVPGRSDTRLLLAAIDRWGLARALDAVVGMFAFALWDGARRRLRLVRDRMGEKPLYYSQSGGAVLFASELRALRAHPRWSGGLDRSAVTLFLRHGYVPAPYAIAEGARKVRPGCIVTFDAPAAAPAEDCYWRLADVAARAALEPFAGDGATAVAACEAALTRAVDEQMVADVPVGAFLSGGIDSSLLVALMQGRAARPVMTFTIGFDEPRFDESAHAARVAAWLGTEHHALVVRAADLPAMVPRLAAVYDEPFGDSSQLPTLLVSQLARQHVTVALSGDGGDELFAGYAHYRRTRRLWRALTAVPRALRHRLGVALAGADPGAAGPLPLAVLGDRWARGGALLAAAAPAELHREVMSHARRPAALVIGGREPPTAFAEPVALPTGRDLTPLLQYLDQVTFLPDDILVKVDRAAMSVSLETRAPYLDHRVVELAWRLPPELRERGGVAKWPLRRILDAHVPRRLVDRPKAGFAVPLDAWLAGPLRDWAAGLLDPGRLRRQGLLDAAVVQRQWGAQLAGAGRWRSQLWNVLMLEAWLDAN